MSGRLLLDTNAIIAHFSGLGNVERRIADATELFVSTIVIGELHYGAEKSVQRSERLREINDLLRVTTTIGVDNETAVYYGTVRAELSRDGNPIPDNDCWIAAQALQHRLEIVTSDKQFGYVPGLVLHDWKK